MQVPSNELRLLRNGSRHGDPPASMGKLNPVESSYKIYCAYIIYNFLLDAVLCRFTALYLESESL